MLGKRKSSKSIAPVRKRRKGEPQIEQITFDFGAREDYLTGFHKRKLQRIKHAKDEALKKEREDKVAARKALRESRKLDREKHVEAVNAAVRDAEGFGHTHGSSDELGEQWDGIEDHENVNHEDDYLDDERYTTVTVEAVDVSREGLIPRDNAAEANDDANAATQTMPETAPEGPSSERAESGRGKRPWSQHMPDSKPRKKKKFRYESKAERKVTRFKERMGGKAKAKVRRG